MVCDLGLHVSGVQGLVSPFHQVEYRKKMNSLLHLWLQRLVVRDGGGECRPLIYKHPPQNRDYNRDPNIKTLRRRGL